MRSLSTYPLGPLTYFVPQIQTCGGPTTGFFRNNLADASPMECVLSSSR